jgi:competence protein ComEA
MKTVKHHINKNAIYIAAFLLIVLLSIVYKVVLSGKSSSMLIRTDETAISSTEPSESEITTTSESDGIISVYICGAVNEPGVYEMGSGALLNDVITEAGGFTDDAADEYIDLVYVINDNMSVYIPTLAEIGEDGLNSWGNPQIYFRSDQDTSAGVDDDTSSSGLININTASKDELMTLPGIGAATATAIIAYRDETSFVSTEDIMNVSGIGESKYNRIKDLICV